LILYGTPLAAASSPELVEATALDGCVIIYGGLAPDAITGTPMPWFPLIAKGISIRGYTLFELTYDPRRFGEARPFHPTAFEAAKEHVMQGLSSRAYNSIVAEVFSLDRFVEAHKYVEENQKLGKVVVRVK
jgi:NADPH:quinone reductase-like Zn-dependent oxidoreductase